MQQGVVPSWLLLSPKSSPRLEWSDRDASPVDVLHWGQRKLLMAELLFLMDVMLVEEPSTTTATTTTATTTTLLWTLVYAGAAPGTHLGFLMSLFPQVERWVLYDGRPTQFEAPQGASTIVERHEEEMTLEIACDLGKKYPHVVFLSDVRVGDGKDAKQVATDMQAQAAWYCAMNARYGLLKFRLPWTEGSTEYLQGRLMLPLWGPHNTTECRLMVTGQQKTTYDHRTHWEQMCHHNRIVRGRHLYTSEELDDCFDCRGERWIWQNYIGPELGDLQGNVNYMSQLASRSMWSSESQRTLQHKTEKFFPVSKVAEKKREKE